MRLASAIFALVLKFGGVGLLVLGILDSSYLFAPWGNDLLLIALTVRNPHVAAMVYYAVMSTIGSVLGCLVIDLTLRRLGEKGLEKYLSRKQLKRVRGKVGENVGRAIAGASLAPPPFPFTAFLMAAVALQYPRTRLLAIVGVTRLLRFLALGVLALQLRRPNSKLGKESVGASDSRGVDCSVHRRKCRVRVRVDQTKPNAILIGGHFMRAKDSVTTQGAAPFVPEQAALPELRAAAQKCEGCELYRAATQAVMGEGPVKARVVMVGEQPGDKEDVAGLPFVGPAGGVLDRALADAGIHRADVYLTNAVKHFKFEERGKRRIHKKPAESEVDACKPWLWAELTLVRPELIVCLGATAARCVIGKAHRLLQERGKFFEHPMAKSVMATGSPFGDSPLANCGAARGRLSGVRRRLEAGS